MINIENLISMIEHLPLDTPIVLVDPDYDLGDNKIVNATTIKIVSETTYAIDTHATDADIKDNKSIISHILIA